MTCEGCEVLDSVDTRSLWNIGLPPKYACKFTQTPVRNGKPGNVTCIVVRYVAMEQYVGSSSHARVAENRLAASQTSRSISPLATFERDLERLTMDRCDRMTERTVSTPLISAHNRVTLVGVLL